MTAELDFPNGPALDQLFRAPNAVDYDWAGNRWVAKGRQSPVSPSGSASFLDIAMWYPGVPPGPPHTASVLATFVADRNFWFPWTPSTPDPWGHNTLGYARCAIPVIGYAPVGVSLCKNSMDGFINRYFDWSEDDDIYHHDMYIGAASGTAASDWETHFVPGDVLLFVGSSGYSPAEGFPSTLGDISITLTATLE